MPTEINNMTDTLNSLIQETINIEYNENIGGIEKRYKPFFILAEIIDERHFEISSTNGQVKSVIYPLKRYSIPLRTEIRIGHYESCGHSFSSTRLLKNLDPYAIRQDFFNLIDEEFWECIRDFEERYAKSAGRVDSANNPMLKFSREEPAIMNLNNSKEMFEPLDIDIDKWKHITSRASSNLKHKDIINSSVDFHGTQRIRCLVNSEGTKVAMSYKIYKVLLKAETCDYKNRVIEMVEPIYSLTESGLPNLDQLTVSAKKIVRNILDIRNAPVEDPGEYPTIMDPSNHGVLWHEAIGHSLEAHRLIESDDDIFTSQSETFKGKIGHKVTADFITVYDDPTLDGLAGSYSYDHEGVRAQKVLLIECGELRNYLHSRETAGKMRTKSNGHARSGNSSEPIPRMSNLIIKSQNEFPYETLKEMLIKECEKQGKDYGLMLCNTIGGQTATELGFFNVFPRDIFRVYPDGSMQRVRGIYQVGTPFTILSNISATSDDYRVIDGSCWAESGYVPCTETAPHALFSSVEVARFPPSAYTTLPKRVTPVPDPSDY